MMAIRTKTVMRAVALLCLMAMSAGFILLNVLSVLTLFPNINVPANYLAGLVVMLGFLALVVYRIHLCLQPPKNLKRTAKHQRF